MQSTLGATLLISVERIAATALGALAGRSWQTILPEIFWSSRLRYFALGLLSAGFRMEKTAYR